MKFLSDAGTEGLARYFLLLIPVWVLLLIYWPTPHFFANQYDDSYITYRYAINLAEGHGGVFNIGERTDSASSFLYTVALSLFWLLGFKNLELIGALMGVVSLAAICVFVFKLAAYLTRNNGLSMIAALLCGLNGFLSGWALSGMETLPWSLAVLVAIYLMVTDASGPLIALAVAAAAFTRFEGILLAAPYFLFLWERKKPVREFLFLFGVVAAFGIFYIIKHAYYGVWISHAFKMKEIEEYYKPDPHGVILMWLRYGLIPVMLSIFALVKREHWPVLLYLGMCFISLLGGPKSDWSRYSVHLLPVFYSFAAVGLAGVAGGRASRLAKGGLILMVLLMAIQSVGGEVFNWRNMTKLAEHQVCRNQLGAYIESNIPADNYIASHDLGGIAYAAKGHRFVDIIGLTSADVLANYEQGKAADDILKRKNVTYIADTFGANNENALGQISEMFPRVTEKTRFRVTDEPPLFRCTAGGLNFQLSKIQYVPGAGSAQ
jgi:hypothetical protein